MSVFSIKTFGYIKYGSQFAAVTFSQFPRLLTNLYPGKETIDSFGGQRETFKKVMELKAEPISRNILVNII